MNKMFESKFWTSSFKKMISTGEEEKKFLPLRKLFSKTLCGTKLRSCGDVRMSCLSDELNRSQSLESLVEENQENGTDNLYPVDIEESFSHLYETVPSTVSSSIKIDNTSPRFSGIFPLGTDSNSAVNLPPTSNFGKETEVFVGTDNEAIEIASPEEQKSRAKICRREEENLGNLRRSPRSSSPMETSVQRKTSIAEGLNTSTPIRRCSAKSSMDDTPNKNNVGAEKSLIARGGTSTANNKLIETVEIHSPPNKENIDRYNTSIIEGLNTSTPIRRNLDVQRKESLKNSPADRVPNKNNVGVRRSSIYETRRSSNTEDLHPDSPISKKVKNDEKKSSTLKKRLTHEIHSSAIKRNIDTRKSSTERHHTSTSIKKELDCPSNTKNVVERKSSVTDSLNNLNVQPAVRVVPSKGIRKSKIKKDLEVAKAINNDSIKKNSDSGVKFVTLTKEDESKKVLCAKPDNLSPVKHENDKDEDKPLSFRSKIRMFDPKYKKEMSIEKKKNEEKVRIPNKHKKDVSGDTIKSLEQPKKDRHKSCLSSNFYVTENKLSFFDKRAKPIVDNKAARAVDTVKISKKNTTKKQADMYKSKMETSTQHGNLAKAETQHSDAKIEKSAKCDQCEVQKNKEKGAVKNMEFPYQDVAKNAKLVKGKAWDYISKWNAESEISNAGTSEVNQEELVYKKCVNLSPKEVEFLKKQKELSNRKTADIIERSMRDPAKMLELVKAGEKLENCINKSHNAKRSLTFPRRLSEERLEAKKIAYAAAKDMFGVQQCKDMLNLIPNRLPVTDLDGAISPVRDKVALFEKRLTPTYLNTKPNNLILDEFGKPISPIVKENLMRVEDRFVVNIFESRLMKRRQETSKLQNDKENDNAMRRIQLLTKIHYPNTIPDNVLANYNKQRKFENSPPLFGTYNKMEYNEEYSSGYSTIKDDELLTPDSSSEEPIYATPDKSTKKSAIAADTNNNCKKFLELKQEVDIQGNVMKQASKALEFCKGSTANIGSLIEAEKILLAASYKYESLMKEIRRDYVNSQGNVGTVAIQSLKIALKPRKELEWFVVILAQEEKVFSSKVVEASPNQLEIDFSDHFIFENLEASFNIKITVYSLKDRRKVKDSKFTFNKNVSTICGKRRKLRYKDLQTSTLVESDCSTSSFELLGTLEISVKDITSGDVFTFDNVSPTSSLSGPVILCGRVVDVKIDTLRFGFLNIGVKKSGVIVWNRRWCVLAGNKLKVWNYPNEEDIKDPIEVINLIHCTGNITAADRSQCPRPKTLMLVTLDENCESEQVHYLNADTVTDFNIWRLELNYVFDALESWKVLENRISTYL